MAASSGKLHVGLVRDERREVALNFFAAAAARLGGAVSPQKDCVGACRPSRTRQTITACYQADALVRAIGQHVAELSQRQPLFLLASAGGTAISFRRFPPAYAEDNRATSRALEGEALSGTRYAGAELPGKLPSVV